MRVSAEISVPMLGESVLEATVGAWRKQEGQPVAVGEVLVELETDKGHAERAADRAGTLERILHPAGDSVHPGDVLATISEASAAPASAPAPAAAATPASARAPVAEAAAAPASASGAAAPSTPEPTAGAAPAPEPATKQGSSAGGVAAGSMVQATPLAQRVAAERHVDLGTVHGSGPNGRILKGDIERAAQATAAPVAAAEPAGGGERAETRQRLSRRRATIARRLVEAQHAAAMLTTFNEIDMSAVIALRTAQREGFKQRHGVDLGFMSFFTKASIGALRRFPQVNAELQGEELVLTHYYDVGIAIGDPEGLVVPVLRDAQDMTFAQIEQAIAGFVQKSRERSLTLDDLRGGTFTITNGGVYGSLMSTPILNPPQVAILGLHKIEQRPVAVDGQVAIRPMMYVALSYDHRVVDGREAVQFLAKIKAFVEQPELLLLDS